MKTYLLTVAACGLLAFSIQPAAAAEELPQGHGISARHPGDEGIAEHPAVLFSEFFEGASVEEIGRRWQTVSNRDNKVLFLSDEVPPGSTGRQSIRMTATLGENNGGHFYTSFEGVDRAFLRFYVKFAPDIGYLHHFVELGGYHPPLAWPHPRAGTRPAGDDRLLVCIDIWGGWGQVPPPGNWSFYAYWPEMRPDGRGSYWGNLLQPDPPQRVPLDQWQCVEMMIQMNDPDQSNGELALWLDGKLVHRVQNMRLRTSDVLKVNHLWLQHTTNEDMQRRSGLTDPAREHTAWIDHVVVSREYIGPIFTRP